MATGSSVPSVKLSRFELAAIASGVLSESVPIGAFQSTQSAPTSQVVYAVLLGLRGGDKVTGVLLRNAVGAVGTLPTTARFGIADATGKILALSGNDNALALWPVGANPHAFTAAYTVPSDGGYFACFVVNGTWSVTQPTPLRSLFAGNPNFLGAFGTFPSPVFDWTGQTDLPAVNASLTITDVGSAGSYYMAFY